MDEKLAAGIEQIKTDPKKAASTDGMVLIKGGTFSMGGDFPVVRDSFEATALPQPDELPRHKVEVGDFYMDDHEITVGEFLEFVEATGYVTVAEQDIDWEELKKQVPPGTPKPDDEMLKAGALVFRYADKKVDTEDLSNWWEFVHGANWKNPNGKQTELKDILNYPVTQISWYDAMAYAKWVGKRLPTEAEFEYAMRGGDTSSLYPWGNERVYEGKPKGNFYDGPFPYQNTKWDGYEFAAPIKSFPPNPYGLYDIAGNVWEWTLDWYNPGHYFSSKDQTSVNPFGPEQPMEIYNQQARNKVLRGGSYLCQDSWCSGYRNARRMRVSPDTGMEHLGFRLVREVRK